MQQNPDTSDPEATAVTAVLHRSLVTSQHRAGRTIDLVDVTDGDGILLERSWSFSCRTCGRGADGLSRATAEYLLSDHDCRPAS